jgi:hypothetical protein
VNAARSHILTIGLFGVLCVSALADHGPYHPVVSDSEIAAKDQAVRIQAVDPIVEEPLRPLFSEEPVIGPVSDQATRCGALGLPGLAVAFLLLTGLRLSPATRRQLT